MCVYLCVGRGRDSYRVEVHSIDVAIILVASYKVVNDCVY